MLLLNKTGLLLLLVFLTCTNAFIPGKKPIWAGRCVSVLAVKIDSSDSKTLFSVEATKVN